MYKNIKCVLKRDNTYEDYEISKLQESVESILKKINEYKEQDIFLTTTAKKISFTVSDKINNILINNNEDYVSVESIHNYVCDELFSIGYNKTARAFIQLKYDKILSEKEKIISSLRKKLELYEGDNHE